jgi:DNA-binding CsgD family transcriptional regulator
MRPQPRSGYLRVRLLGPCGQLHYVPVHKIVLEAFVGPRPSPRHHGAHKSGDKNNNRLDNLLWKLPEDNEADKKLHGTAPKGGARKPSHPARVRAILRLVKGGKSYTQVADRFGLHRHSVSRIVRGLRRRAILDGRRHRA